MSRKNRKNKKNQSNVNIRDDLNKNNPVRTFIDNTIFSDYYMLLILVITIIGAYLRIHNLGVESLWLDEASSYHYIQDTMIGSWTRTVISTVAPLHTVILHFMTFFSSSEFSLRLPSAIFGTLTIPVIYAMGTRLFGKEEGILSAFLLSISMMHLWYSQEARMYAQTVLFSLLSLYFFYCATKANSKKIWAYFVVFSSLAFYSHYYTIFVIIPEAVYYVLTKIVTPSIKHRNIFAEDWQNVRMFCISIVAFFITILPLFIPFVQQAISRTSTGAPTWGIGQSLSFIPTMLIQFSTQEPKSSNIFLLVFIIGLIASALRQKDQFVFMGIFLVIPFIASYILAAKLPFSPRYLLFLLPVYLILVSRGITAVVNLLHSSNKSPSKNTIQKRHVSIIIIALLFLAITLPHITTYYDTTQKNDWRTTSLYLESVTQPGNAVAPMPGYMFQALGYYYDNSSDGTIRASPSYSESKMSSFVSNYDRVWFLVTGDINAANPDGSALRWLQNNASFVNQITGIYIFTAPKI